MLASEMQELADTANHDLATLRIVQGFEQILKDIRDAAAKGLYEVNTDYLNHKESKVYSNRLYELGYAVELIHSVLSCKAQPLYILIIKWGED